MFQSLFPLPIWDNTFHTLFMFQFILNGHVLARILCTVRASEWVSDKLRQCSLTASFTWSYSQRIHSVHSVFKRVVTIFKCFKDIFSYYFSLWLTVVCTRIIICWLVKRLCIVYFWSLFIVFIHSLSLSLFLFPLHSECIEIIEQTFAKKELTRKT